MTSSSTSTTFQVKKIRWSDYEHETPILLQDANGPCPLIALVNTLLLQYEIEDRNHKLDSDHTAGKASASHTFLRRLQSVSDLKRLLLSKSLVTLEAVLSQLGDILMVFSENDSSVDLTETTADWSLSELLENLPLLHTGLNVNPNLTTGEFSPTDLASILFRKFRLNFNHGWCLDQVDSEGFTEDFDRLVDVMTRLQTFDEIQDFISGLDPAKTLVQQWLDLNKTQLTKNGLKKLNINLQPEEFTVFFRNNHFNTLYKRADNDFYLLITDASFSSNNDVVWQSLISVLGKDDLFFTGDFIPVFGDTFDDYENTLLVKKLQEQEDRALAAELQKKYLKPAKPAKPAKPEKEKKEKRKRDCVIC